MLSNIKYQLAKRVVSDSDTENFNISINNKLISNHLDKINVKNYTILDAGCGKGENCDSLTIQHPNAKIIGMDIHLPDLNIAKEKFGNRVEFIHSDCLKMKLPNECVDIVISNQVIEHITDYNQYIYEIFRVLKPGGLLIISTPNFHNPRNVFFKLFFQKPIMRWENRQNLPPEKYRGHVKEFYENELISILEEHKFIMLEKKSITPSPSKSGNAIFITYRILEYFFYLLTKPFVRRGYNKNHNIIFQKR